MGGCLVSYMVGDRRWRAVKVAHLGGHVLNTSGLGLGLIEYSVQTAIEYYTGNCCMSDYLPTQPGTLWMVMHQISTCDVVFLRT